MKFIELLFVDQVESIGSLHEHRSVAENNPNDDRDRHQDYDAKDDLGFLSD